MSTPSSRTSSCASTWVGIALGLVILGLVAAFAIALPKAHGEEQEESPELSLSLPDELPGGYLASDDAKSFEGGQLASQAEAIAKQESAAREHGDEVLPDVLGNPAVTRTYVAEGTQAVFVQVFQSQGGAFAPNSIPDPETTGGQPTTEMKQVGDGACILSYSQGGSAPAFTQCQVTDGELTAQVGSSSVDADAQVKLADALLADLQDDQDQ